MEKRKVFVYGTLRKGETNHFLLDDATCFSKQAWTNGVLYDTGFGFPAMMECSDNRVYGEIYEVTMEQLKKLDSLEGYRGDDQDNHYHRIERSIFTDAGQVEAYLYVYKQVQTIGLWELKFGDWRWHRILDGRNEFLYFAYGSCMDDERFVESGVSSYFSKVIGCGKADGYSLGFTRRTFDGGRADMMEVKGDRVEGKVYEIQGEALSYLYGREGVDTGIYRPAVIDILVEGKRYENVITFFVIEKGEEMAPPHHYAREILRGAKGFVSEEYYNKLRSDLIMKFQIKIFN
ncbi:gamma-glutamylcyclotransferase [Evansella tamaricis]|uniref:Gamma-glutamylcyclotransferase n=1 Tax=Evansella tamaricis TaxID=2069301 RepID=A0ABS6JIV8_9BACI|nr:gamma-glutamylcyclotransferase family protein [Evansella tamaricis]MBU9713139.1 gamma-glutamylcyclotransferase [Evansella tamaricis]